MISVVKNQLSRNDLLNHQKELLLKIQSLTAEIKMTEKDRSNDVWITDEKPLYARVESSVHHPVEEPVEQDELDDPEDASFLNGLCEQADEPRDIRSHGLQYGYIEKKKPQAKKQRTITDFSLKKSVEKEQYQYKKTYVPTECPFEIYEEGKNKTTPSDNEDFDLVRESIKVIRCAPRTVVFVIVLDKNKDENNVLSAIRCHGGVAFGGYARDASADAYIVKCCNFVQIGQVPFSLAITMPNIGGWKMEVPIPEKVLEKHLTPQEKHSLEELRKTYPVPEYEIHLIQMLGCN